MATIASLRCSAECTHCGATLIFPEWSESVGARDTINIWHCAIYGNEFETTDKSVEKVSSDVELIETFLPNLLVA